MLRLRRKRMSKVLVVAAHPDDEILGVGGTVAKHSDNGDRVECLILGEGQTSRWNKRENAETEVIEKLHKNTLEAAKIIGYNNVEFSDLPDNRFDHVDMLDIVKIIELKIEEYQPDIVYTHHGGDLNIDHQCTFRAVLTATRPVNNYPVKEIYTFETLSSTEWNFESNSVFKPNVFIDIEQFISKKIEAMNCYHSELCVFPHPRSIEGIQILAKRWGMVVGRQQVEAFELIRKVL